MSYIQSIYRGQLTTLYYLSNVIPFTALNVTKLRLYSMFITSIKMNCSQYQMKQITLLLIIIFRINLFQLLYHCINLM